MKKDYFGLGRIISIILAIIPVTAWILGVITRFSEKKYLAAVIRLVGFGFIIWIFDAVSMILNNRIFRLLEI